MSAKTTTKKSTAAASAAKTAVTAPTPVAPAPVKKPAVDVTKLEKDIRSVPIDKWDWSRVVYGDPQKGDYGSRVRLSYMYDDKTVGPAIVSLGRHYCFGVQPDNTDKDGKIIKVKNPDGKEVDKPLSGYRVPIVMTSQNKTTPDPTPEEQSELDFFEDWRGEILKYSVENKVKIGKGAKTDAQIEGLVSEILYYKKDAEGNIVEGVAPKFYTNLIYYSKTREVGTNFYGPGDKPVNPLTTTGHFHMNEIMIRFESIFVGGKSISLQHHIYEANIEPLATASKKRLTSPNTAAPGSEDDFKSKASAHDPQMMESEDEAGED